jgi:DNA helicase-2/ATP-dependent DNA helicase PcrA
MVPTNAQPFETGDVVALALDSPKAEAEFIATTVKQLRGIAFQDGERIHGLSYSDCAILLRSVRANADPIVSALNAAGIPAIIIGMNHLFDTQEAQAARLIFYFMVDRNGTDRDTLRNAWLGANVGIRPLKLDFAIYTLQEAKGDLKSPDQKRWGL